MSGEENLKHMNVENVLALADHIEGLPNRFEGDVDIDAFNMQTYAFSCGTPACIAGHAAAMSGLPMGGAMRGRPTIEIYRAAQEWLGLNDWQAKVLFLLTGEAIHLHQVDAAWATRCLRHLAATGTTEWELTRFPELQT